MLPAQKLGKDRAKRGSNIHKLHHLLPCQTGSSYYIRGYTLMVPP